MRNVVARTFWTFLAGLFLVEAWLWDVVGGAFSALAARLPLDRVRRGVQAFLARAPAGFAFALFAIPMLVILPLKLLGVALIAKGRILGGCFVFLLAKTAGLGATAFVFDICRSRLMTIRWFAHLYGRVMRARNWADRQVAPYKAAIRTMRSRLATRLSERSGSFGTKIYALRADIFGRSRVTR